MADEASIEVTPWSIVWVPLLVSALQGAITYFFFARRRAKDKHATSHDLYERRTLTRSHRSPAPFGTSWIKDAWNVSNDDLLRYVGLDTYMFLRFLRLGARSTFVGSLLGALILIPVYGTGEETGVATDQFNTITLAKVEAGSSRLWATIICWCIFIAFILRDLWIEWNEYADRRRNFLAKGDTDTEPDFRYTCMIENVPKKLQSNAELRTYLERMFPNKVRQVHVCLDTSSLDKLIAEREKAILGYEKSDALIRAKPDNPTPQVKEGGKAGCGGNKVDAVPFYTRAIERLNEEIDTERRNIWDSLPAAGAGGKSDDDMDDVELVFGDNQKKGDDATSSVVEEQALVVSTAFVTFTSLVAKQTAVQCNMSGKADCMDIFPAPIPEGVIWNNVTVPLKRQSTTQAQAGAFWTVGILFWAVPVTFVTSIANINSLLGTFGLTKVNPNSFGYGLLSGLLPVIFLQVLMIVLYLSIGMVGKFFIRMKSMPNVDNYVLFWHQLYQFANLWLILIGGSMFNQIDGFTEDPSSIITILATAVPGAGTFFFNVISVQSFGTLGMELSQIVQFIINIVMDKIQPEAARTQRMLDEGKKPKFLEWGKILPKIVFVFLVSVVYMPIVPLLSIHAFAYFGLSHLVWKHQCMHVYAQEFEGGGILWETLFMFIIGSLYMAELIFVVFISIKEGPIQAILGLFPLGGTMLLHAIVNRNIRAPLQSLGLEIATAIDLDDGELPVLEVEGFSPEVLVQEKLYGQPALKLRSDERSPMPYRRVPSGDDMGAGVEIDGVFKS